MTVTASLMLLVFGLTRANQVGWTSAETIGVLVASAVLMAAFLVIEHAQPFRPDAAQLLQARTPTGANIVGLVLGTVVFGMFYLLSLYQQQVLGYSAVETGVGYLAVALTAIVASGVAQALVTRIGVKPCLAFGMACTLGGLLWFTQISIDGTYFADLFGGFMLIGVGLGFAFVPVSIAALAGIPPREAGLASGLINTSQQIGGALGVAILTTVATTHTDTLLADGDSQPEALTGGFSAGVLGGGGVRGRGGPRDLRHPEERGPGRHRGRDRGGDRRRVGPEAKRRRRAARRGARRRRRPGARGG